MLRLCEYEAPEIITAYDNTFKDYLDRTFTNYCNYYISKYDYKSNNVYQCTTEIILLAD